MFVRQEVPVSHHLLQPTGTSEGHLVPKHPKRGTRGAFSAHTSPAGAAPPTPGARTSFSLTQPLQAFTPCRPGLRSVGCPVPALSLPKSSPVPPKLPAEAVFHPSCVRHCRQRGDRGHRDLSLHQTSGTALLWPSFPAKGRAQPVFIALARGILELTVPGADV